MLNNIKNKDDLKLVEDLLLKNISLDEIENNYQLSKNDILERVKKTVNKILNNNKDISKEILELFSYSTIVYLGELNFTDEKDAIFYSKLLCYQNKELFFDDDLKILYSDKNYSLENILAIIKINILDKKDVIFSYDSLASLMSRLFVKIDDIDKFIKKLQSMKYIKIVDDEYFFPFLYQTKKQKINFYFTISSDAIQTSQNLDKIQEDLEMFFPNSFNKIDLEFELKTDISNSRNIISWGEDEKIHKNNVLKATDDFDFEKILTFIDSILDTEKLDLKIVFDKFKIELDTILVENKYALHSLLKLKFFDRYNYIEAPYILKVETIINSSEELISTNSTIDTNKTNNLIVLYNPYYNKTTIEDHLDILKENGVVAFGKVLSKLRNYKHPNQDALDNLYDSISEQNPMQLFLTDYDSIYVANVIDVVYETNVKRPDYYDDMEVESWFIFDDLRLLVDRKFTVVRDEVLTNFKTIGECSSTYALYGNSYVYPLQVSMKDEINYFKKDDENYKYYVDIFKSQEQLDMKQNLIEYNFGEKRFYSFDTSTQENLVNAEVEYSQNKDIKLYDFKSVVTKYSSAVEYELWSFLREVFKVICNQDVYIAEFEYTINGRTFPLSHILKNKATFGTYGYILRSKAVIDAINTHLSPKGGIYNFIFKSISYYISIVQSIRNRSVHENTPISLEDCAELRKDVIGIGKSGMIAEFHRHIKYIENK